MNVAYYIIIPIIVIFLWIIFTFTVLPLIALVLSIVSPYLWNKVPELPGIKQVKEVTKYVYSKFIMKILLILWCVCVFCILVLYVVYYIAKNILLKEPLAAPMGKLIIDSPLIAPFVKIGLFPLFDKIVSIIFPTVNETPSGTINDAIRNFSLNFIKTIKSGSVDDEKKPDDKTTTTKISNLSDEQSNTINTKFEKCIKDTTLDTHNIKDSFSLFTTQLKNTNANIVCEIQKIKDSFEIKNTK